MKKRKAGLLTCFGSVGTFPFAYETVVFAQGPKNEAHSSGYCPGFSPDSLLSLATFQPKHLFGGNIVKKPRSPHVLSLVFSIGFLTAAGLTVQAQTADSLEAVTVSSPVPGYELGQVIYLLDSQRIEVLQHQSLGKLIGSLPQVFIQRYGTGGLELPSIRGTGAVHTQILWKGLSLNSPLSGQADLSTFSSGTNEGLHLAFGTATLRHISGAFGGTIDLQTRQLWGQNRLEIAGEYGSFDSYAGLLKGQVQLSKKLLWIHRSQWRQSENDFTYFDSFNQPASEKRFEDAGFRFLTLAEELYWRPSANSQLNAALWYQDNRREIGSSILVPAGRAELEDEALRGVVHFLQAFEGDSFLDLTLSHFRNRQAYSSNIFEDNDTQLNTTQLKADQSWTNSQGWESYIGYLGQHTSGETGVLRVSFQDWRHEVTAGTEALWRGWGASVNMRGMLTYRGLEGVAGGFSLGKGLVKTASSRLQANFSLLQNYRVPSVSELRVEPWANPDLQTEKGSSLELGLDYSTSALTVGLKGFANDIRNRIIWQPRGLTLFQPVNIDDSQQWGLSLDFSAKEKLISIAGSAVQWASSGHLSLSRAVLQQESDKQLIFLPQRQAFFSSDLSWRQMGLLLSANLASRRWIDAANTAYLPAYYLFELDLYKAFSLKKGELKGHFRVENLFDYNYQVVPFYPIAGRSFFISLGYSL